MFAAAACGPGVSAEPAGTCGLLEPAFCETFGERAPGGRGGEIDERRFGVARLTQGVNAPQGYYNAWALTTARGCSGPRQVGPGTDYFICAGALRQAFHDGGQFAFHSFRIRQPFDFAGRVGTVAFDVDVPANESAWIEVWLVEEPVPGPQMGGSGVEPVPRTGIGFRFGECTGGNRLSLVRLVRDFRAMDFGSGQFDSGGCFPVMPDLPTHLELKLGEGTIELFAGGVPSGKLSGLELPLTRGYLHFQQVHDNPSKWGHPSEETRVWDDLAFDGPALPLSRGYDVPDNPDFVKRSDVPENTVRNTGYPLRPSNQQSFELARVQLAGAAQAFLTLNAHGFTTGTTLRHRWNGGEWRDFVHAFPSSTVSWRSLAIPVLLEDLREGKNTLELRTAATTATVIVANIDLTLVIADPR